MFVMNMMAEVCIAWPFCQPVLFDVLLVGHELFQLVALGLVFALVVVLDALRASGRSSGILYSMIMSRDRFTDTWLCA